MPIFKIQDPDTGRTLRVEMDSAPTQEESADIFASAPPSVGVMREMESRPVGQGGLGPKQPSVGNLREMESRRIGDGGLGPKQSMADIEEEWNKKALSDEERQVQATKGFARYAPAIGGPLLFPPAAGATIPRLIATGLGYGVAAGSGELAAEAIEGKIEPKKVAGAAIRSVVPMPAGSLYAPMAAQAGANLTARYLEEGKITPGGAALDVGIPGTIAGVGSVGRAIGGMSQTMSKAASRGEAIEKMAPGMTATVGQMFESAAPFEQRMMAKVGGRAMMNLYKDQTDKIVAEINRIRGGVLLPDQPQDIVKSTAKFLGLEDAQELANKVSEATKIDDAIKQTANEASRQNLLKAKLQAEEGIGQFVQNSLMKGPTIPQYRAVQSGIQMENFAEDLKTGLQKQANKLYAPAAGVVDNPVFSLQASVPDPRRGGATTTIEQHAKDLISEIPDIPAGGLSELKKLIGRTSIVAAPPSMNPTAPLTMKVMDPSSHNELRGVLRELYDFADSSGEAIGSVGQRKVKQLIQTIKESIDVQAPTVLGKTEADAIKAGNQFYAENRPLLDTYGVRKLFAPETQRTAQGTESAVRGISAQGLDAPEINNLLTAHETLRKSGAAVPALDTVFSDIRAGIVSPYVDKLTGNFQKGAFEDLAKQLAEIEKQTPGTLGKLGFGSRKELNDFIVFLRASKDAGPEATEKLLRAGVPGWTLVSSALDMMPNVRTSNTLKNYLQKEAVAGNKNAIEALDKIKSRAIEDALLITSQGQRRLNLNEALDTLADPRRKETLKSLIGPSLLTLIEDQLGPGMRVMKETETLAGRAGTTVGGVALEQSIGSGERAASQLTTGQPANAVQTVVDALYRRAKYATLAKWFANGSGSSGLKSKASTLKTLERILTAPGTPAERAIQQSIEAATQPEPSPE